MFHDTSRSIAETFHKNRQVQKTLSSEAIAEIAAMKKVIINCFENPDWDSCDTDCVANALIQSFGGATYTAFLDVLFERHNNKMIDPRNKDDYNVINGFWGRLISGSEVSGTDLLRITEMLMWEGISSHISIYEIIYYICDHSTTELIPNLERARDSLPLDVTTRRELEKVIMICRSRS
jgi:hypothetical protein